MISVTVSPLKPMYISCGRALLSRADVEPVGFDKQLLFDCHTSFRGALNSQPLRFILWLKHG